MTYVALVEAVAFIVVSLVFAQVIRQMVREHARERTLMLNQIMHLAGRTWQPPPSELVSVSPLDDEELLAAEMELLDPAQLPTDYN